VQTLWQLWAAWVTKKCDVRTSEKDMGRFRKCQYLLPQVSVLTKAYIIGLRHEGNRYGKLECSIGISLSNHQQYPVGKTVACKAGLLPV
jgi:hypothetical protein